MINKEELAEMVIKSAFRCAEFEKLTNGELAELLLEKLFAELDIFTEESDLISTVIDRLNGESG